MSACYVHGHVQLQPLIIRTPLAVTSASALNILDPPGLEWAAMSGTITLRHDRFQNFVDKTLTRAKYQCDQAPSLSLTWRYPVTYASSVALPRNLVNVAVVLGVVLGSRTVEMSATQSLITHGPRASRLATVG